MRPEQTPEEEMAQEAREDRLVLVARPTFGTPDRRCSPSWLTLGG